MARVPEHDEIYRISGKWATEDFGAAKLLGLRQMYPERYQEVETVLSLSEWIGWIFTGRRVMEYSQACESQLYDISQRNWSQARCSFYGLNPAILPPLQAAGTVVGPILETFRRELHLAEDAVFVMGGADTQIALLQTHIRPGDIAVVSGTTSPVITEVEQKFYDREQRVWTDAGLGAEGYQVEMNPGVTGLNYQRIKEQLCPDIPYEELEGIYREKTRFHSTASFSSLLFYQRRALRRGGFFMRAPLAAEAERTDLVWAVLADIACSIHEQLQYLARLTGNQSPYILGCGGGFQSEALCQMLADLSGRELRLRPLKIQKALFLSGAGHLGVHLGPLLVLAGSSRHQVLLRSADAAERLEPELCMLLLIERGLLEDGRDLLIAVLLCLAGKIVVLVPGLGLPGKRLPQIGLRLASLQFHNRSPFIVIDQSPEFSPCPHRRNKSL